MTFLNAALLYGAGMIAVPIVMHLIMRQKPKLLEFPALRFLQRRHDRNQRSLQLRHLLLLLLRAGAIAMLALALARPSVKLSHRFGSQEAPVAAALVFDAAPHMQYRHDKKTRLEAAQEVGQWLLQQLPPESQIAVCDSSMAPQSFDPDRGLSKQRIGQLDIARNPRPLTRIVGEAARVLQKSDLQSKEIYIFTDLSRASWPTEDTAYLQDRLREVSGVSVYLIDVGVTDPSNFALGDLSLSRQVVAAGAPVDIQTEISCTGAGGERMVELDMLPPDGKSESTYGKMDTVNAQKWQLHAGETQSLVFHLPSLKPGTRQGLVKILGQDPLAADDVRYFTIEVRPPWPVLIVAQPPADESAFALKSALTPADARKHGAARFVCDTIDYRELDGLTAKALDKYAAICLLDPPGLEAGAWQTLTDYAAAGHGVGVFLGRHAQPRDAFNSPAAQQLLPGKLEVQVPREDGGTYLAPQNFQNPILKPFASFATRSPWRWFPVYRYWRVDVLAGSTIIEYNDRRPMLLQRTVGAGQVAGRVLMTTTPFSDRGSRQDAWNKLPIDTGHTQNGAWPFMILADKIVESLVGSGERRLNYLAGVNTVLLPINDANQGRIYVLQPPVGDGLDLPRPEKGELSISGVDHVGNYQVYSTGEPKEPGRGFSVNLPARLTELARLSEQEVHDIFGPFAPQLARSSEQIVRNVHDARVGREIYAWLIIVVAGLLSMEYIVSNWFYKPE
jgi:hypothetical protein